MKVEGRDIGVFLLAFSQPRETCIAEDVELVLAPELRALWGSMNILALASGVTIVRREPEYSA